ncbi:MAG: hypothetical protein CM15mP23_10460 [Cryomorphaceae bacterium]|nr:MAG: hypothetical protein CM15mP23_10460 [Cryomorphaceae bacterium]
MVQKQLLQLSLKRKNLLPGESVEYVVIHGITDSLDDISRWSVNMQILIM